MLNYKHRIILLQGGAVKTAQLKLEDEYHEKLQRLCLRFGVTKADLVRFMLDTVEHWGVTDDEFDRWYAERNAS